MSTARPILGDSDWASLCKAIRTRQGLSQRGLAALIVSKGVPVSQTTICLIESGKRQPWPQLQHALVHLSHHRNRRRYVRLCLTPETVAYLDLHLRPGESRDAGLIRILKEVI